MICYLKGGYKHGSAALALRSENARLSAGGLQISTGLRLQPFRQDFRKDKKGHGWWPGALKPPGALTAVAGPARVSVQTPQCSRGHPSSCSRDSLSLFVPFHGFGGGSEVGGIRDTGGMWHTGGFRPPADSGVRLRGLYAVLVPGAGVHLGRSPPHVSYLEGPAGALPWSRAALAWGGGGQGQMCESTW